MSAEGCFKLMKDYRIANLEVFLALMATDPSPLLRTDDDMRELMLMRDEDPVFADALFGTGKGKVSKALNKLELELKKKRYKEINGVESLSKAANPLQVAFYNERSPLSFDDRILGFLKWSGPEQDLYKPDPLRAFIKCFVYNDAGQSNCDSDLLSAANCTYKNEVLWEAYSFRKAALLSNTYAGNKDLQRNRKCLKTKLAIPWTRMGTFIEKYDAMKKSVEDINAMIDSAEWFGTFMLVVATLRGELYGFTDTSPECPGLMEYSEDGSGMDFSPIKVWLKNEGMADMRRYVHGKSMPPYYHAKAWDCTHGATTNMEESAMCHLECDSGYKARRGITICDSLGGAGIWWSHANMDVSHMDHVQGKAGSDIREFPACCPASPIAAFFRNNTITTASDGGTWTVEFWNPTAFGHSCAQGYNDMFLSVDFCTSSETNFEQDCNYQCAQGTSSCTAGYPSTISPDSWEQALAARGDQAYIRSSVAVYNPAIPTHGQGRDWSYETDNVFGSAKSFTVTQDVGTSFDYVRLNYYGAGKFIRGPWRDKTTASAAASSANKAAELLAKSPTADPSRGRSLSRGGVTIETPEEH